MKRVWLHKHEWEQLVIENFQSRREFPCEQQDCAECSKAHEVNLLKLKILIKQLLKMDESKRLDCQAKLNQINNSIKTILLSAEKRANGLEPFDHCTHLICSKFIYNFRFALR